MGKFLSLGKIVFNRAKAGTEEFLSSSKPGFQYALFLALNVALLFNPITEGNVAVKKFNRTFGMGTMYDWDCSRVIQNFYAWVLLFTVLLFGSWIFFAAWKRRAFAGEEKHAVCFLDGIMVLGCVYTGLRTCSFFLEGSRATLLTYSSAVLFFAIASAYSYLVFRLEDAVTFAFFQRIVISLFALSFCASVVLKATSGRMFAAMLVLCLTAGTVFVKLFRNCEKSPVLSPLVKACSVTVCFFPLMTSLYFELLNILNSRSVFVAHWRRYYAVASFLLLCCTASLALIVYRKKLDVLFWKRIAYPALVLGLAALSTQPAFSSVYGANIFESANTSIPVSNFLCFGKIPVVTCYPGHMMTGVWQAFLYAALNGDKAGAVFSPYAWSIEVTILSVLFFCFVRIILNADTAFFTVLLFPFAYEPVSALLFPFTYGPIWNYFGMGMLLALAAVSYVQKPTMRRAFMVWLAFVWCALYRLDTGFAFFSATAAALALWVLRTGNRTAARQLIASFAVTAASGFVLWCVLCIASGASPFLRLLEFLSLSASNPNWAYNTIGNKDMNLFAMVYLVLPFTVAVLLSCCILSKRLKEYISPSHRLLLVIFGFSFIFNMPRALVRHSVAEMTLSVVLWTAPAFIAAALSALLRRKGLFLPILAILMVPGIQAQEGQRAFRFSPIMENVLPQIRQNIMLDHSYKRERVIFEPGMRAWCDSYRSAIDRLLEDDETYLDFMNRTFVYSAIGRECPVYVTQSPLQLSGEFTQEMFIKEISGRIDNVPLALLPLSLEDLGASGLDGIMNSYRYYKVAEFISAHYRPLCRHGDFAVWVLNERYEDLRAKLGRAGEDAPVPIGWDYGNGFHNYSLGYLPLLWAEKDTRNALQNKVLAALEPSAGIQAVSLSGTDKAGGNYLHLRIVNPGPDKNMAIWLGVSGVSSVPDGDGFSELMAFSFTAANGEHDYLVRVSCDYLWYFADINAVSVEGDGITVSEFKLLEGD